MSRVKVRIKCMNCGETFILRGRKENGTVDTGFRMCICNNEVSLEIEEHPL